MLTKIIIIGMAAVGALAAETSPAQLEIASVTAVVQRNPKDAGALSRLAMAYSRRARETGDPQYYATAMDTIATALKISPDNYEALRAKTWTLLGQHEFAQAAELAEKLNQRAPDDVLIYGFLTDAYVELGHYDKALESAQWMLDIRPGTVPGLTRAAYIRELYGFLDGAIELMEQAYDRSPYNEKEDLAWIQVHLAHLGQLKGGLDSADAHVDRALTLFPDYHYALAERGRLRLAQGRYEDAAAAFETRYKLAAHPENLFEWAEALKMAGKDGQADEMFPRFEKAAVRESDSWDNANRELIAYYVDYADRPLDALKIATRDFGRRQDVFTRASYAWALFHTGQEHEAMNQMKQVLKLGVIDPRIARYAEAMHVERPARELVR
jgi:tetratricopeptide (TPR) repeat protein